MIFCCSSARFLSASLLDLAWSLFLIRPAVLPKLDLLAIDAESLECLARDLSIGRDWDCEESGALVSWLLDCMWHIVAYYIQGRPS